MLKHNAPPAAPASKRGRKSAITRESVVEDVKVIGKEVDVTQTSSTSSAKKVPIWIGGDIIGSINNDVVYGQPDFENAVEHVEPADNDVDFGCQDNDYAEENAETRNIDGQPKKKKKFGHWMLYLLWIQTFCLTLYTWKLKKGSHRDW